MVKLASFLSNPKKSLRPRFASRAKRILVVDQDEYVLDSMRVWLKETPYELETARDGFEGLECLNQEEYGLLFCAASMEGALSGIELLRGFRTTSKVEQNKDIPAILMVESGNKAEKELTHRMKLLEALYKPFDEFQLAQILRIYLR